MIMIFIINNPHIISNIISTRKSIFECYITRNTRVERVGRNVYLDKSKSDACDVCIVSCDVTIV